MAVVEVLLEMEFHMPLKPPEAMEVLEVVVLLAQLLILLLLVELQLLKVEV
jgi:hypothetical protein|tara:strand:- start:540 stop:692 length:153 start_codon:yes stop_codon:yes gene_type:complete